MTTDYCARCRRTLNPDCEEVHETDADSLCEECHEEMRMDAFDGRARAAVLVAGDGFASAPAVQHVTIKKFAAVTGFTEDAIRSRIKRGDWRRGEVCIKAGDRVLISLEGYQQWLKNNETE